MVIDWNNLKLLFTAPRYKQECSTTRRSNPEPKPKKSTKISTKAYPAPKDSTRFYQPKISTDIYQESKTPIKPYESTLSTIPL